MTKLNQIYKCNICGNITEVIHEAAGELVCCGKPMEGLIENSVDAATEKHVPIIEKTKKGIMVIVGSVEHPMQDEHYIEWIEVISKGIIYRQKLKSGGSPKAMFKVDFEELIARAYCNLHGLWISN